MLIDFSFGNFTSFKDVQSLSMMSSKLKKDNFLQTNVVNVDEKTSLLKSALIYGANASGKSNLINAMQSFRTIVLSSLKDLEFNFLDTIIPFLLTSEQKPSIFEILFIENSIKYRYGFSILNGEILEEWLYSTTKVRETMLFYREKQTVEFNKKSFNEAKLFVKFSSDSENKKDNMGQLEKTATNVPFVSVLSVFEGKHSSNVTNFISRINAISGIQDERTKNYSFNLFKENEDFRQWALKILENFNISDLIINEEEVITEHAFSISDEEESPKIKIKQNRFNVEVQKQLPHSEDSINFPFSFESAGTRKIIHLLGPLYDTIKSNNILFIDELDAKFHTLLSKFLLKMFNQLSNGSQLIATVQDTNLMNTELLRRDQIWFVDKDPIEQDSRLYSLSEYKISIQKYYSSDYLEGAFSAIPLFSKLSDVENLMEG